MIFGAPGMLNWIGYPLKSERGRIIVGDKDDFLRSKKSVLRSYAYIGAFQCGILTTTLRIFCFFQDTLLQQVTLVTIVEIVLLIVPQNRQIRKER